MTVVELVMPSNLVEAAERQGRQAWLASLPATVIEVASAWSLRLMPPFQPGGTTAWVAPVVDAGETPLVLKVGWRHLEAAHEADGLRTWDGEGAVRIFAARALEQTMVMLIERCVPGHPLSELPEPQQDPIIAALLRRLWRQPSPGHPFRPLQELCDQWAEECQRKAAAAPGVLDRGLVRKGIDLFRSLPETADQHVLLCTDLHAGNVLASQREDWLMVDPKPYVGDPAYDLLQHLLNSGDRLRADPHQLVRHFASMLDLNAGRVLQWLFARCVIEAFDWPGLADVARRVAPS